jgi:hypothetical protein
MDTTQRLVNPPQDLVDRLATEEHVIEQDIRAFSKRLDGLTVEQGIALLNDLTFRRSWNTPTFMAANEVLDAARQQLGEDMLEAEVIELSESDKKISNIIENIRKGRHDAAALIMQGLMVERLTQEVSETLDTHAELSEDEHFEDILEEFTMELVIAHADRLRLGVRDTTTAVDTFMTAHVRPLKDTIIADVVSNLASGTGARVTSRVDNDA